MVLNPASTTRRNPGPSWGYQLLRLFDRVVPEVIFRPMRAAGTLAAMVLLGERLSQSSRHVRQMTRRRVQILRLDGAELELGHQPPRASSHS